MGLAAAQARYVGGRGGRKMPCPAQRPASHAGQAKHCLIAHAGRWQWVLIEMKGAAKIPRTANEHSNLGAPRCWGASHRAPGGGGTAASHKPGTHTGGQGWGLAAGGRIERGAGEGRCWRGSRLSQEPCCTPTSTNSSLLAEVQALAAALLAVVLSITSLAIAGLAITLREASEEGFPGKDG